MDKEIQQVKDLITEVRKQVDIQQRTISNINDSLEYSLRLHKSLLDRVDQLERDVILNAT